MYAAHFLVVWSAFTWSGLPTISKIFNWLFLTRVKILGCEEDGLLRVWLNLGQFRGIKAKFLTFSWPANFYKIRCFSWQWKFLTFQVINVSGNPDWYGCLRILHIYSTHWSGILYIKFSYKHVTETHLILLQSTLILDSNWYTGLMVNSSFLTLLFLLQPRKWTTTRPQAASVETALAQSTLKESNFCHKPVENQCNC